MDEQLKNALCTNDTGFLKRNMHNFSIDRRFEEEDNDTLLLYAISDPGSEAYKYLLEHNADIYLVNDEGEGLLHAIVFSGDIERLHEILNDYEVDINLRAKDGATPLLLALSLEKFDLAKVLVSYGADVTIGDDENVTPLHLAAQSDALDIVELLLQKGADVFCKTDKGNLPLALAVNEGHIPVIRMLYAAMYED